MQPVCPICKKPVWSVSYYYTFEDGTPDRLGWTDYYCDEHGQVEAILDEPSGD